jgi:predicted dehydrogenase
MENTQNQCTRRDFMKTSAALSLGAMGLIGARAYAAGSDTLRIGLIGCGGRGRGAAMNILDAAPGVELYALADLFQEPLDSTFRQVSQKRPESSMATMGNKINVTRERCFVGFDAYQKLINCGIDIVLMATPPHFRPIHLQAAVQAGKHSFIEKPVAVDPVGVRSVIATSELARKKNLAIVAGTQRRHSNLYMEIIKRIHRGDIGRIVGGQTYYLIQTWNGNAAAGTGSTGSVVTTLLSNSSIVWIS